VTSHEGVEEEQIGYMGGHNVHASADVSESADPSESINGDGSGGAQRDAPFNPGFYASCVLLVGINMLLLSGHRVAFVGAIFGFWLVILHPTYQIFTTRIWKLVSGAERLAYSLAAVLLVLMLGGLFIDVVRPHLGVPRPLAQRPVLLSVDVLNVGLMGCRMQRGSVSTSWRAALRTLAPWEWRILTISTCCVPLVVAGANRLNNGSGDLVALIGLCGVAVTFALMLWRRTYIRDSVVAAATYLLGLSLLLATSLRGWYITGHDIQREYRVFELTKDHGVWNIGNFRDPYNACLSLTILPTEIWQMIRVDDPYVYKVFFQLLFAMCPVLVYVLARRYWSKQVGILSVVYFVGFPTFFTDMPFLNRQEIAFLFVGVFLLAMTRRQWSVWRRRVVMVTCALGIGLSHYSTMYVFVGTLAIGLFAQYGYLLLVRLRRRPKREAALQWGDTARTITLGVVIAAGLVTFVWGGVITRTATGVVATIKEAFPAEGGTRSAGVSYALFSGSGPSSQDLLNKYRKQTLHTRKKDDPGSYLPLSKVLAYPTTALKTPSLPLTSAGKILSDAHVPVATLNSTVRGLASKGEQVFIGVGLVAVGLIGWRRRQVGKDFYFLSVASIVMVGAVTVLPGLSVSYGLLRALQQALILVAPILVIGSFVVFKPLGEIWSKRAASIVALVFLVSTVGILPQILGGYPAQLNLNNSGVYYDNYYVHPQEVDAVQWLGEQHGTEPIGVQAENFTDEFYFKGSNDVSGAQFITDIYPTLIRKSTWVVLGDYTVRSGIATASASGNLISYRYPMALLKQSKDLVYDNGSTVIYK
jgi:uncharacterized membrane protein